MAFVKAYEAFKDPLVVLDTLATFQGWASMSSCCEDMQCLAVGGLTPHAARDLRFELIERASGCSLFPVQEGLTMRWNEKKIFESAYELTYAYGVL
jgi:hypothetical protein